METVLQVNDTLEPGLLLIVNGHPRRLRALSLHDQGPDGLPVWTAEVDHSLGCAGTLEGAVLMGARAADLGIFQEIGEKH